MVIQLTIAQNDFLDLIITVKVLSYLALLPQINLDFKQCV